MSSGKERFNFNERMRPIADVLYQTLMPGITCIKRFDKDKERFILDFEYGIDIQISLVNGMILTGQEKFREFAKWREQQGKTQYSDVTVEYYNNPILKVKGDWFNLASQFYFVGFASKDESSFDRYVFLDWLQVVLETVKGNIVWGTGAQSNGWAKASFKYTPFNRLPEHCIIATKSLEKIPIPMGLEDA